MPKRWNIKIIDSSLERIIVSIPCFSDRIDQDVHRLRKKKKIGGSRLQSLPNSGYNKFMVLLKQLHNFAVELGYRHVRSVNEHSTLVYTGSFSTNCLK